jgi:hypothetical protein
MAAELTPHGGKRLSSSERLGFQAGSTVANVATVSTIRAMS